MIIHTRNITDTGNVFDLLTRLLLDKDTLIHIGLEGKFFETFKTQIPIFNKKIKIGQIAAGVNFALKSIDLPTFDLGSEDTRIALSWIIIFTDTMLKMLHVLSPEKPKGIFYRQGAVVVIEDSFGIAFYTNPKIPNDVTLGIRIDDVPQLINNINGGAQQISMVLSDMTIAYFKQQMRLKGLDIPDEFIEYARVAIEVMIEKIKKLNDITSPYVGMGLDARIMITITKSNTDYKVPEFKTAHLNKIIKGTFD